MTTPMCPRCAELAQLRELVLGWPDGPIRAWELRSLDRDLARHLAGGRCLESASTPTPDGRAAA